MGDGELVLWYALGGGEVLRWHPLEDGNFVPYAFRFRRMT